jgi:hypothetical protein
VTARAWPTQRMMSRHLWAAKTCSTATRMRVRLAVPRAIYGGIGDHQAADAQVILLAELRRRNRNLMATRNCGSICARLAFDQPAGTPLTIASSSSRRISSFTAPTTAQPPRAGTLEVG